MSLFKRELKVTAEDLLRERLGRRSSSSHVSPERALRHSAVWACRRLRADLVSTMPVDVFRDVNGYAVEQRKPPIFVAPGGEEVDWCEWAYSSTDDLDALGNTAGIITARDGNNLPARIELFPFSEATIKGKGSRITEWKVSGEKVDPADVWHEKQHTRSGLAIGLSPIAYAAMSIGGYLSAQEFAEDWFNGAGIPRARLKNVQKTISPAEAKGVKERFRASVTDGDLFVHGSDWEFEPISAKASESSFIDQMRFSVADVCRFMGVPADMIDADTSGSSITYANITQRNLQLLILNLNPLLRRREAAFSRRLLPQPRYMRFNRAALLEMDLKTRYEAHKIAIDSRFLAPSEVRAIEDRAPLTPEQLAEFSIFAKAPAAAPTGGMPA